MRVFAFVRNIMIGREGMATSFLLKALTDCGVTEPESFLSTGNFAFNLHSGNLAVLEVSFANLISRKLGRFEPVFCRSFAHLNSLVESRPFEGKTEPEIYERCISFLNQAPSYSLALPIISKRGDVEVFKIVDSEAYSTTRLIKGRTSNAGAILEPLFSTKVTTRNWNTVLRLHAKFAPSEAGEISPG
jgi:uncharacterized protein (DUF1697 family)